jgi:glycerophosphoryl diester phosphodiesterase
LVGKSIFNSVQRIAHRGGSLLAPENTLAAFDNALALGVDAIELDVQMSRDGQAIIFHDNTIDRLTDGRGNILDQDFTYLRSLNAAAHFPSGWFQSERIPTLREVLDLAKGRVSVHIEIKNSQREGVYGRYPNIAETVVAEIQAANMLDQALIISFDWHTLSVIKSLEPSLETGVIVSRQWWSAQTKDPLNVLCDQATSLGCPWIDMDALLFSPDMPDILHQRGFQLGIWTVNSLDELHRFTTADVGSLTTDRPDLFAQLGPLLSREGKYVKK